MRPEGVSMLRVRTMDELLVGRISGTKQNPGGNLSYTTPVTCLGVRKVTVDNVRPPLDFRYDCVPSIRRRTTVKWVRKRNRYQGSDVRKMFTFKKQKVYVHQPVLVKLRRPSRVAEAIRMNDFQVDSLKGFATIGCIKTNFPVGWTSYVLRGQWAAWGLFHPNVQPTVGYDIRDLTRPLTIDSWAADVALQRAVRKVHQPDADFGEVLGEFHQLLSLARSPLEALASATRKFQRWVSADQWIFNPGSLGKQLNAARAAELTGPYAGMHVPFGSFLTSLRTRRKVRASKVAKTTLDEAANRWLVYRYGIVPIISDLTVAINKLNNKVREVSKIRCARATVVSQRKTTQWEGTTSPVPGWEVTNRITVSTFDRTTAKVYYKLDVLKRETSLRDLGLDQGNLLPLVWKLTAWSFVVDWFLGVEDWLYCWNPSPGVKVLANCVSRKIDVNVKVEVLKVNVNGYDFVPEPGCKAYFHRQRLARQVNRAEPPWPVLNFDFLRWRRVVDTFSLIWAKMPYLSKR